MPGTRGTLFSNCTSLHNTTSCVGLWFPSLGRHCSLGSLTLPAEPSTTLLEAVEKSWGVGGGGEERERREEVYNTEKDRVSKRKDARGKSGRKKSRDN